MKNINPVSYSFIDHQSWEGRNDGSEISLQRWHQRILRINLLTENIPKLAEGQKGIALIGFACDEGVRRNGGRTGAQHGPHSFRKASSNLPVHFEENLLFIDLGDINCHTKDMETAQQDLAVLVKLALDHGYQPLVIGGGHEVAYAHYSGISQYIAPTDSIGIINFDAHFDLREPGANGTHSGTGFLQIARDCETAGKKFSYLPIGIQQNSNTPHLFATAAGLGVQPIPARHFRADKIQEIRKTIQNFIAASTCIYLTLCLDVFSSSVAPGVSAQAYSGLFPDAFFFDLLHEIKASGKVVSMDIAELNPLYDTEERTAKLAAALAFELLSP